MIFGLPGAALAMYKCAKPEKKKQAGSLLLSATLACMFKMCIRDRYKVLALVMLFVGGIAAYTFVWDLGDVGIGLMTIFNTGTVSYTHLMCIRDRRNRLCHDLYKKFFNRRS